MIVGLTRRMYLYVALALAFQSLAVIAISLAILLTI